MNGAHRYRDARLRWLAACGAAALALPALAADKPPAPGVAAAVADEVDQDLLEFLGSVDTETDDITWFDFLRSTDIGKLARAKPRPVPPQEKK